MDFSNFDARNIAEPTSYDPIPAGWYKAVVVNAEERPTKAQTGSYIRLEIEVIDGEYQGRKIFENLNTENENQTARDIAIRQLGSLCRSINTPQPRGLSDLCDKPFMAKVAIRPPKDGYSASNTVREYGALDGAKPAAAAPAEKASTPPWKR